MFEPTTPELLDYPLPDRRLRNVDNQIWYKKNLSMNGHFLCLFQKDVRYVA